MTDRSAEFIAIAEKAGQLAKRESELEEEPLKRLEDAAETVSQTWSKSNLGYRYQRVSGGINVS